MSVSRKGVLLSRFIFIVRSITGFIGNLAYVAICILGGYLTANGKMTVGGIQAFIQYVRSFTQPISQIATISNVLQQTAAAAERVFEFLDEQEEAKDAPDALSVLADNAVAPSASQVKISGNVGFENATFGYDHSWETSIITNRLSEQLTENLCLEVLAA